MALNYLEELDYSKTNAAEQDYPKFDYDKAVLAMAEIYYRNLPLGASNKGWHTEYKNAIDKTNTIIYKREKEKLDKILAHPRVGQLIPKEYWADLNDLIGPSSKFCGHQHMLFAVEKMIELSLKEKRTEIAVISPCSGSKPYSDLARYKRFIDASKSTRLFDFLICSVLPCTITPFDASVCYPIANYSMPIFEPSEMFRQIDKRLTTKHLVEIIQRLGYKKLIFVHWEENELNVIHLIKEYGFPENAIIEPYKIDLYRRAHMFNFSTKELPEPKKFWKGIYNVRFTMSKPLSCFMRDVFGPSVYPFFKSGWDDIDDITKQYAGYSEKAVEKVRAQCGLENLKDEVGLIW